MRLLAALGVLITLSPAAHADGTAEFAEKIMKCWNVPAGVEHLNLKAHFDVELNDQGEVVDITAKAKQPVTGQKRVFILSASRAIERCSPYSRMKAGVQSVVLTLPTARKPINPFK